MSVRGFESSHHLLWPRKDYRSHHHKRLRSSLVVGTEWEAHRDLHAHVRPPQHPDIGIVLHLLDRIDDKQPAKPDIALFAIDQLIKQGSEASLGLADHFVTQLGYLGISHG